MDKFVFHSGSLICVGNDLYPQWNSHIPFGKGFQAVPFSSHNLFGAPSMVLSGLWGKYYCYVIVLSATRVTRQKHKHTLPTYHFLHQTSHRFKICRERASLCQNDFPSLDKIQKARSDWMAWPWAIHKTIKVSNKAQIPIILPHNRLGCSLVKTQAD